MPRKITTGVVGGPILGSVSATTNIFESVKANENIVLTPNGTGVVQATKDIYTSGNAGVRFGDSDTNYALIKAPSALTGDYTLTLPANDGDNRQTLTTDGSGTLSWVTPNLTVTNRTAADNSTYYITMSDGTTGTEDTLSVADGSRLNFVPNPGRLTSAELRASASTASSSTSTGSLVVTGGAGIGGQLTAISIVETSSIALKENVNPIQNALDSVLQLKGVTYDRLDSNEHESGLIAEWTENVLPELVTRDTNGDVVGIKYTKLSAYLIEAIKSLKAEIDELKKK
jgi:hypothetical protein